MDCSMWDLPVCHQSPVFAQTHVHWTGDAIQPSHFLLFAPPPAFSLSQKQGISQWASSSHQVAKVLEFHIQHQCFQWISRTDFLYDGLVGSPCCPRDSQESSPTPQFKRINSLTFFIVQFSHLYHDYWKTIALTRQTLVGKVISLLFNKLSRLIMTFLPRSKCLLISWLQSPSTVILEP